jgi:hypothetical protein
VEQVELANVMQQMELVDNRSSQMMVGAARRNSNKYPNNQLDTSLHFDKFFSDKANNRKQH